MTQKIFHRHIFLTLAFAARLISADFLPAQEKTRDIVPAPKAEAFAKADELAVPWRETGCRAERTVDCYMPSKLEYENGSKLTLYNKDGSTWYQFSIAVSDPNNLARTIIPTFVPFAGNGRSLVILRVVAISGPIRVDKGQTCKTAILLIDCVYPKSN